MRALLLALLASPAVAGVMSFGPSAASVAGQTVSPSVVNVTGSVQINGTVVFSTGPFFVMTPNSLLGTLSAGATFYQTTLPRNVTLVGLEYIVLVAGVAGSGDSVYCGNGIGSPIGPASSAAAAALGTKSSYANVSVNLAAGTTLSCYIAGSAATKPIVSVALQYQMQ